ncbi:MAG: DsbA family protein [Holosporales bacterium]|nr:DsbA family protein [Holosporales bacterium]
MRLGIWSKVLVACCFITTLYAQQASPVYPANAGQAPAQNPDGQYQGQQAQDQFGAGQQYAALEQGGTDFLPTVFINDSGTFKMQTPKQDDMKKAIVVFYSVACPHCDTLLATLAPHVGKLKKEGIKLIFMNVPAGDKLQGQQPPTMEEYNQAVSKVTAHGITIDGNNTQVVVVADVATLSKNGITGLPVMMVIKKSVEQSRGIGQDAIQKVKFGDPATFSQLQAVFNDVDENERDTRKKQKGADTSGGKSKGKQATKDTSVPRGINRELAREWTTILNSECSRSLPGATNIPPQLAAPAPEPKRSCKCTCD